MVFSQHSYKSLLKIHITVLHKIAIDLFYSRSMAYKAEAVFSMTYFKAEAVIGRPFSKIVVLQCSFFALVEVWRDACDRFDFSSLFISSSSPLFY